MSANRSTNASVPDCTATCQLIQEASTETEVMQAVREYLDCYEPRELAAIPVSLLTLQINHARDIAAAAVELARHEATATLEEPQAAVVKDMAKVLSTAAMRLALIS